MGDQICQFDHSKSTFILWKVTSTQLKFESARLWYLKPGRENAPTTRLPSPIFRSHPYGHNFYLNFYPYGVAAAIGKSASISLSISAGEYEDILSWPISKTIQIKVRDQLNPLNTCCQTIESKELTKPTSTEYSTVPTVRRPYFFPHSKLFNDTDGYLHNGTIYIEVFFDPLPPNSTCSVFSSFSFSVETPNHFQHLITGVSCRVSQNAKQAITLNSASSKHRNDLIEVIAATYRLKG